MERDEAILNARVKRAWKKCKEKTARQKQKKIDLEKARNALYEKTKAGIKFKINNRGYVEIHTKYHPLADKAGYVFEHRIIAERMLGRFLKSNEIVHHKNRIRWDNRPENLEVCESAAEHGIKHRKNGSKKRLPGKPNELIYCECGCGNMRWKYDKSGYPRRFINGHQARAQWIEYYRHPKIRIDKEMML